MPEKNNCVMPSWKGMIEVCENSNMPWMLPTASILRRLENLNLTSEELSVDGLLPIETYNRIVEVFDEELQSEKSANFHLEMCTRFNVFQTIVGILILQIPEEQCELRQNILQLSVAVMLRSIRQPPFTMPVWKQMVKEYVRPEVKALFHEIVCMTENRLMAMSGNTVYSFFSERCSKDEVDQLLARAHDVIKVEDEQRRYTIKHGHGHSKCIITMLVEWMDKGKLKDQQHIFPLIKSLSAYWHHEFNLGTSQGTEKIYKKLNSVYY